MEKGDDVNLSKKTQNGTSRDNYGSQVQQAKQVMTIIKPVNRQCADLQS